MSNIVKINSVEDKCWDYLDGFLTEKKETYGNYNVSGCKIALMTLAMIIKSRQVNPGDKSGYCNKCKGTFGDIEKHNEIAHSNGELTEKSFTTEVFPKSMRS